MPATIKQVHIDFDGSSVMSSALEDVGAYRPSRAGDLLTSYFSYAAENAGDKEVTVAIKMTAGPDENDKPMKDTLSFAVYEYQDTQAADYTGKELDVLSRFDLELDEVFGKDWKRYLEVDPAEESRRELHGYLAQKLKDAIEERGLRNSARGPISELSNHATKWLIGTFNEYRRFAYHPNELVRVLGLG